MQSAAFSICVGSGSGSYELVPHASNERLFLSSAVVEAPLVALSDSFALRLFCGPFLWHTFHIHLSEGIKADGRSGFDISLPYYAHQETFPGVATLEINYQALIKYEEHCAGLARKSRILGTRLLLHPGWCQESARLNAANANADKIVLYFHWGRESLFAWRPQRIETDYATRTRTYTWLSSSGRPRRASVVESEERLFDQRRFVESDLSRAAKSQLPPSPRRFYVGDHDTDKLNPMCALPLDVPASLDRSGVRLCFFNLKNKQGHLKAAEAALTMRHVGLKKRRKSLCLSADEDSSGDEREEEGATIQLDMGERLTCRIVLRKNAIAQVALSVVDYDTFNFERVKVETPRTV